MGDRYDEARNVLLAALEDINHAADDDRDIADFVILSVVEDREADEDATYTSYSNGLAVPPHVRVGTLTLAAKRAVRETMGGEEDDPNNA
jgi:hypothetical protein